MKIEEEIVYKSSNENKYLAFVFVLIMIYSVGWSVFKAPIILCYSIPMLIIVCWIPVITAVTKKNIYFFYPYRFYSRRKRIPLSFIKSVGTVYLAESFKVNDYKFLIGYYKKKTNDRFKLNDYKEIYYYVENKQHGKIMFDLFERNGIKTPDENPF